MSAVDYVGRTVDLAAFQGAVAGREILLTQAMVTEGNGGYLVTGIMKLVQRFLVLLFTDAGSLRYQPSVGCLFLPEARRGLWRTAADVRQSFLSAVLDINRQLREMEEDDDPDDERIAKVVLNNVVLNADTAVLYITLTADSGDSTRFITPLPTVLHG